MKKIKIKFVDFWPGFINNDNYFYNLLSEEFIIELSDKPELIFYSSYGKEYLNYKCIRIFYCAENERPDFTACDYALTFDFNKRKNHFRLPLFVLYINPPTFLIELQREKERDEALRIWKRKTKFCCMVVSNPNPKKRINFFKEVSVWKKIDSGGKCFNNVGGIVEDKLEFIKDYKFVLSFENSSYPGYTTEKIMEPLMVNSIPIYWGNKRINEDINKEVFINVDDFRSYKDVFNKMIQIDNNDELALEYIMHSKLAIQNNSNYLNKVEVLNFLKGAINDYPPKKPVASTPMKHLHIILRKWRTVKAIIRAKFNKNFR